MDDLKDLVKASLGSLPMVCQEQVLLDMERTRMQAEDNKAALTRTEKKRKRLEERNQAALMHVGVVRDELLHVLDRAEPSQLPQEDFAFALSAWNNALTYIIDDMQSDSEAEI
jgi:small-conductance mechanosensitive channel